MRGREHRPRSKSAGGVLLAGAIKAGAKQTHRQAGRPVNRKMGTKARKAKGF